MAWNLASSLPVLGRTGLRGLPWRDREVEVGDREGGLELLTCVALWLVEGPDARRYSTKIPKT